MTAEISLTPAQESRLLAAARSVPDAWRDDFFRRVASILRPIRYFDDRDLRRAVADGLERYRQRPPDDGA